MHRILIIDDDPNYVEMTKALFEGIPGVTVAAAYDGVQGMQMAAGHPPHLVVLDLTLPKRDGFSVLRLLKRDPLTAHARVIVVTGNTSHAAESNARKLGADNFLLKPFNPDDLLAEASALIDLVPA